MKEVLIHSFCSDHLAGSPQFIRFYDNDFERKIDFNNFQVTTEFDYSFATVESDQVIVNWKNKAGNIQFCGSAAYALAWYLLTEQNYSSLKITSNSVKLFAEYQAKKVKLSFPARPPHFFKEIYGQKVYFHKDSGVYFVHLPKLTLLYEVNLDSYCSKYDLKDIHGLCFFHWDEGTAQGSLRYFTPWHGRQEDYITGSVQQTLTPLVSELYGANNQKWQQLSQEGGQLNSTLNGDRVTLEGDCRIVSQ